MHETFATVLDAVNQANQAQRAANEKQARFREGLRIKQRQVTADWFSTIMQACGIEVPEGVSSHVVDGFSFWIDVSRASGTNYYPLALKAPKDRREKVDSTNLENYVPESNMRCDLVITNTNLEPEYSDRAPGLGRPYAERGKTITINDGWGHFGTRFEQVPVAVGEAILFLKKEQEEAPQRKADIDTRFAEKEAIRKAAENERQAREAEERAKWEAEYDRQEAEMEQRRKAREAQEAQYRAEIAEKFGVSSEAFTYLIEMLADEIDRRHSEY